MFILLYEVGGRIDDRFSYHNLLLFIAGRSKFGSFDTSDQKVVNNMFKSVRCRNVRRVVHDEKAHQPLQDPYSLPIDYTSSHERFTIPR